MDHRAAWDPAPMIHRCGPIIRRQHPGVTIHRQSQKTDTALRDHGAALRDQGTQLFGIMVQLFGIMVQLFGIMVQPALALPEGGLSRYR
jgi:hypothetical protein